jgi:DNA-binding response OmpR family regulator
MSEANPNQPGADILIVDDDWMNRELLEAYLKMASFSTRSAENGEQALLLARAQPPDLVLLDLRLPGIDGHEVCRQLKASEATCFTPVLVISALEADDERQQALDSGADDFLSKPYNPLILLARVRSLLRISQLHQAQEWRARRLRDVLERYVAPDVAAQILADLGEDDNSSR